MGVPDAFRDGLPESDKSYSLRTFHAIDLAMIRPALYTARNTPRARDIAQHTLRYKTLHTPGEEYQQSTPFERVPPSALL